MVILYGYCCIPTCVFADILSLLHAARQISFQIEVRLQQINLKFYFSPVFVHSLLSQIPALETDVDYVLMKFLFFVEAPVDESLR